MERKLASIQKVVALVPIEGGDKIELAKIQGWQAVVKKGEFKAGDLGVFFEIDAILDSTNPYFSFLADKKYRVHSMRLKKVLSQGLFCPLSVLIHWSINTNEIFEGDDLTEATKTTKYEPHIPTQLQGLMAGAFPSYLVPQTDELRIQSYPQVFDEFVGKEIYVSQKADGASATFIKYEDKLRICSRNMEFKTEGNDGNLYVQIANELDLMNRLSNGYSIQAEIVGPSIQSNRMGLSKRELIIFNVYDIENRKYLDYEDFLVFVNKLQLNTVKILYKGLFKWASIDEMLAFAETVEYDNHTPAEGLVWRPIKETYSGLLGGRLSIKTINNKFLLKYGE